LGLREEVSASRERKMFPTGTLGASSERLAGEEEVSVMKRNRVTRLLGAAVGTVFMVWAGAAAADMFNPESQYPLPPGEGQMVGSQNNTGAGDKDRDRTGECCDEFVELFAAEAVEEWPHEGPSTGGENTTGQGDLDRDRDGGCLD
jgi:hypothetical protein